MRLQITPSAVPDQIGAVSAYAETRDYSLCRKAIDEITDRWIKYGTQEFKDLINDLKIEKIEMEQTLDEKKIEQKYEEMYKAKEEELKKKIEDKEELAKRLKDWEDKYEEKIMIEKE